jgi:hypothetical protein
MNTDIEQQQPFPGRPTPLVPPVNRTAQEDPAKQQAAHDKANAAAPSDPNNVRRHLPAVSGMANAERANTDDYGTRKADTERVSNDGRDADTRRTGLPKSGREGDFRYGRNANADNPRIDAGTRGGILVGRGATTDIKSRRHQEAVAYRAGNFKLNRSHVIDGVDIVMLAFPAGSVNPGERFAVVDESGQETDALVMQTVGSRVGFSHLKNLTGQDLWKLYGMSPMVDLFNKIKDLASNALNLRIDTIRHSDGGSTTEVVGSSDLSAETYAPSGPMTADPNLQRSTGAIANRELASGRGYDADERVDYTDGDRSFQDDGTEPYDLADANAGNPPRMGEISRKYTGAGSQIESGRYPDISALPTHDGNTTDAAGTHGTRGVSDLTDGRTTDGRELVADGYGHGNAGNELGRSNDPGRMPDLNRNEPKPVSEDQASGVRMETVKYADGTSATGVAPLPRVSPSGSPAI